ncbi:MAG TPA: riboflavin biosynthesis protein RibF [Opitutae bacterium]|nr:riboflavin biosynthesis protein RibF [Opitutae bacterium]
MQLPAHVERFDQLTGLDGELHLAIGVFDGVHLGHKAVIESAVLSAQGAGGISGVLTFDPHPSRLFRPQQPTQLMMPITEKATMLHSVGVDVVIRKHFDRAFASIPAEDFLANLKAELPTLKSIYVGENFRFGKQRAGSVATLIDSGRALGLDVFSVARIKYNGEAISSTRIREALQAGRIEETNNLFGYHYFCKSAVVGGAQLGRQIGFPTLNVAWDPECRPCFGVYLVRFRPSLGDPWEIGVANYGIKPTVAQADQAPALEVHALNPTDLDRGDAIEVEWLRFIRPEQKFASVDALKAQITKDCQTARNLSHHDYAYH